MNVLNELRVKNDLFDLIFSQIKVRSSRNSEWHESLYIVSFCSVRWNAHSRHLLTSARGLFVWFDTPVRA